MANIGTVGRGIRFAAGLLFIALCLLPPSAPVLGGLGAWTWIVLAAGAVLILSATVGFCPAYRMIGHNSCGR